MSAHTWRQCRPAVAGPDADPTTAEAVNAAMQRVWAEVADHGRRLFHEATCLNQRDDGHAAFMLVFRKRVRDQMMIDAERHRDNAKGILGAMDKLGVKVKNPAPGEQVNVAVVRVADSMALGDDPPPYVAIRRVIVTCSKCGENCFSDPVSYGAATPTFLCLRCLHPKLNGAIEEMITDPHRPQQRTT